MDQFSAHSTVVGTSSSAGTPEVPKRPPGGRSKSIHSRPKRTTCSVTSPRSKAKQARPSRTTVAIALDGDVPRSDAERGRGLHPPDGRVRRVRLTCAIRRLTWPRRTKKSPTLLPPFDALLGKGDSKEAAVVIGRVPEGPYKNAPRLFDRSRSLRDRRGRSGRRAHRGGRDPRAWPRRGALLPRSGAR
jgi:hypothetical protein